MPDDAMPQAWRRFLGHEVDAASLGVFRCVFGACIAWDVGVRVWSGQLWRQYVAPPFHFQYGPCPVPLLPESWLTAGFVVLAAAGACLALGVFSRVAACLVFAGLTYDFLLDAALYLNHGYLMCLFALLLCVVPADRAYALHWRRRRQASTAVPFWTVFLLRAQMLMVYSYAGVAKINGDWLRGAPLDAWLADHADFPVLGRFFGEPWMIIFVAWVGMLFDLSIGWLLLWRRTRALALVVAGVFHTCNHFWFDIGVFPILAFAASLNFCGPDWPRRLFARGRHWLELAPPAAPAPPQLALVRPASVPLAACVALWLAVQALIPLRHWFYPGPVNWTEEGHYFSWRMMLRDKGYELHAIRVEHPSAAGEAPWLLQPVADPVPPLFPLPLPLQSALSPEWSRAVEESKLDQMALEALREDERRQLPVDLSGNAGGVPPELDRVLTHRLLYALVQHARRSAHPGSTGTTAAEDKVRRVFRETADGLFSEAGLALPDEELDRLVEGEQRLQRLRLTGHQAGKMLVHPELLRQYAAHVAEELQPLWGVRPRVYVDVRVALNFRPFEPLVSPQVDLAAEPFTLRHAEWIEPLHAPLPDFDERRRRRDELRRGGYFVE
jgi:hypothetical protein